MRTSICAAVAALLGSAGLANAALAHYTDFAERTENQIIRKGGVDIYLNSFSNVTIYDEGGLGGLGIHKGGARNEIGGADRLTFNFSEPVYLTRLTVNKLFAAGYARDFTNEGVEVVTDHGTYTFFAQDVPQGTVLKNQDFGGRLIALTEPEHGGQWRAAGDALFGGPITFMQISATPSGALGSYADFTFDSMNFRRVPAPGAAALLAAGGLVAARRRR